MSDIVIRLAKPADAPDMAEIHARSWEAAYKDIIPADYIRKKNATRPALWRRIITEENTSQYVILQGEKTVGILCVAPPQLEKGQTLNDIGIDDSYYELHGIYLHPDFCRRGIGTKAMEFAIEKARETGKSRMILWVFAENINSIRFYESLGFAADGATKLYNCGKEMKCIRMKKVI